MAIGERVFWSPYILKYLARLGARGEWGDLLAQFRRATVAPPPERRPRWQEVLDTFHELWLESLGDDASLVPPWGDVPWFSSFDRDVVQAVYDVDREIAAERLGILASFDLVQPVEEGPSGARYRWEPLMWDFVRRRFSSSEDGGFAWVERYDGGWGQGPLWRASVPGRSVQELRPWDPRHWGPGADAVSLSGTRRLVVDMPRYAIEQLRQKRLEWHAEAWATWYRLHRRTRRLGRLLGFWILLAFLTLLANWLLTIDHRIALGVFLVLLAVLLPLSWAWAVHTFSCVRAMDRWVYDDENRA